MITNFTPNNRDLEIVEPKITEKNLYNPVGNKKEIEEESILPKLIKTLRHFFPDFNEWINEIKEPRSKNICYTVKSMIYSGLLLFILKLEATRQLHYSLRRKKAKHNIVKCFELKEIPHGDSFKNFLKKLPPKELDKIRLKSIRRLLRNKVFKDMLFLGKYYLIAFDGTELYKFKERHCSHCLTRTHNGITEYYHRVLEAKLILPNGIVISIETEFIENPGENVDKQDCERKAFYRLHKKLKRDFPQLSICLLLDSLFACQQVMKICEEQKWKYIINFKEGSIPTVYKELMSLLVMEKNNEKRCSIDKEFQILRWMNDIDYNEYKLCGLTLEKFLQTRQKESRVRFCWLTNLVVKQTNCFDIGNYGGRLRWMIENQGFNEQKNGGYNLEHVYCHDYNAMKNFYLLLQLGHMINQLLEKGSLVKKELINKLGGIRKITEALKAEFIYSIIDDILLQQLLQRKIQIRFT